MVIVGIMGVKKKTRILSCYIQAALLFLTSIIMPLTMSNMVWATPDPALVGGSAATGYSGTAMPITDLQVSGTGNPTVPVKLRVTSGTLAMTTTTGLTFTGSSTGSTLQFSGTLSNVNAAMATLRYTRNSTGTDTLEASLVNAGEVFFPDNGHLYEYVSATRTWATAKTDAEARTKYGATGYLATITSQTENDFISARLLDAGWMGASDSGAEGNWKWVTGPENGTQFWSGASGGSTVGGNYANWNTGEPNDSGSNEDCGQFLSGSTGKWNDLPCTGTTLPGYVVEYGSTGSPLDISSKNVSITTLAPNQYPDTPISLGSSSLVNGSWITNNTPTFTFSLNDSDVANTLGYQIQVDDTANFSSPVIDYTSGTKSQGSFNFAVGQTAGAGTSGVGSYTTGSAGQTLAEGSYYWRVKSFDNIGAQSSYATANSGAIAFKVDTTAPTTPGQPSTATPTTETKPTWTWTASTDDGSGLNSTTPYTVEWSQAVNFSGAITDTTTTNSFTIPSGQALTDGTWYFRVKTKDVAGNFSGYSTSGSVIVDTTAPSAPSSLAITTASNNNEPGLSWAASTDATSGLATPSYTIEWSQAADFSSVWSATTSLTTYTVVTPLSDGTWYFRVKAADAVANNSQYSTTASIIIDTSTPRANTNTTTTQTSTNSPTSSYIAEATSDESVPESTISSTNDTIVLNNFTEYTDGNGKALTLKVGQVIYFFVDNERHSATIKEIHPDYVIVTIASTPRDVRVNLDKNIGYDVNGDGKNDIIISVSSIANTEASMLFKLPAVIPTPHPTKQAEQSSSNLNYWWIIAAIIGLAIVIIIVTRRKHKQQD